MIATNFEMLTAILSLRIDEIYDEIESGITEPMALGTLGERLGAMINELKNDPEMRMFGMHRLTDEECTTAIKLAILTSAEQQDMNLEDFLNKLTGEKD